MSNDYALVKKEYIERSKLYSADIITQIKIAINNCDKKKLQEYIALLPVQNLSKDSTDRLYGLMINGCNNKDIIEVIVDSMAERIWTVKPVPYQTDKYIECLSSRYVKIEKTELIWQPAYLRINVGGVGTTIKHNMDQLLIKLISYDDIEYETEYLLTKIERIINHYYPDYNFKEPYKFLRDNYKDILRYEPSIISVNYIIQMYRERNQITDVPEWVRFGLPLGVKKISIEGPNNPYSQFTDSHMLFGDDWFSGYCEICNKSIIRKEYSVRAPVYGGGWIGTFCCWKHCKKYLWEEKDMITLNMCDYFGKQLMKNKIYIAKR